MTHFTIGSSGSVKPDYHVVSFSGGKDSTAMLLHMLELNMTVDEILFCDTTLEFPAMYEHIARVEEYIKRPITRIKPKESFEFYLLEYVPPKITEVIYRGRGWASAPRRWCTGTLKNDPRQAYLKTLKQNYTIISYVGIAADEGYRLERSTNQNRNHRHPLVDWGWAESQCLKYCYDKGFNWGGTV